MRVVEGLRAFTPYSAGACTEVSNNLYRRFLVPFLAVNEKHLTQASGKLAQPVERRPYKA